MRDGPELPRPCTRGTEVDVLTSMLELQRTILVRKVTGLDADQLAATVGSSDLHLAARVKHLTLVETSWFDGHLLGHDLGPPWDDVDREDDPDWEFGTAADDDPASLVADDERACARSRQVVADATLDDVSARPARDGPVTLRWILVHMIEETARHDGHADLLLEAIDGRVGD